MWTTTPLDKTNAQLLHIPLDSFVQQIKTIILHDIRKYCKPWQFLTPLSFCQGTSSINKIHVRSFHTCSGVILLSLHKIARFLQEIGYRLLVYLRQPFQLNNINLPLSEFDFGHIRLRLRQKFCGFDLAQTGFFARPDNSVYEPSMFF